VTSREAAELLLEDSALVALAPFLERERTLSEAARELGWKLPRLTKWVTRLVNAALLEITRTEARAGSPVKHYRAAAPVLYLPYTAVTAEAIDAFRARTQVQLGQYLQRGLERAYGEAAGAWGLQVRRHPTGTTGVHEVQAPGTEMQLARPGVPPALRLWDELRLEDADAQAFVQEFWTLVETYRARQGAGRYLVSFGLAPLDGAT